MGRPRRIVAALLTLCVIAIAGYIVLVVVCVLPLPVSLLPVPVYHSLVMPYFDACAAARTREARHRACEVLATRVGLDHLRELFVEHSNSPFAAIALAEAGRSREIAFLESYAFSEQWTAYKQDAIIGLVTAGKVTPAKLGDIYDACGPLRRWSVVLAVVDAGRHEYDQIVAKYHREEKLGEYQKRRVKLHFGSAIPE